MLYLRKRANRYLQAKLWPSHKGGDVSRSVMRLEVSVIDALRQAQRQRVVVDTVEQ